MLLGRASRRLARPLTALAGVAAAVGAVNAVVPTALADGPPTTTGTLTYYVDASTAGANGVFADSGFTLLPGLPVTISATGVGSVQQGFTNGPDGDFGPCGNFASATSPCPLATAPEGSLVAQAGTAGPVFVGAGPTTLTGSGPLLFAFNDPEGYFGDNSGGFTVTITYACKPGNGYDDTDNYHCGAPGQS